MQGTMIDAVVHGMARFAADVTLLPLTMLLVWLIVHKTDICAWASIPAPTTRQIFALCLLALFLK